ncbi:tyrosine recombinase XerC [Pseudoalteromonas tunicata]|uniref:Tyrosine recombinase XerC n=1 Tax=Pseudoalteromonas tunicata D2 TaxID=87626 RepID=A4CFE3_9GAMM|nr:tyrosine recombinase XerC [Pseudoalteromonas tunicata]ATC92922.1 integrase/recombinase XerC [Pseudoalteromonas tunicata]AXT32022.1 tyrosine recombinase XerC [Pseudoalteromonas tunicata]EAR26581.1 site-specific recombinase [Pseudoalteromonas tunicata D2]
MSEQEPLAPSWLNPVEVFLQYLKYEKNYSIHTLLQYRLQLVEVANFLQNKAESWLKVQPEQLRAYSMSLKARALSARTINLKLSCVRSFYKYLQIRKTELNNPAEAIKGPKFQKPLPKNLDVDQMHQLLAMNPEDSFGFRDKAMMELMYSSGLRVSELVNANLIDVNLREKEIRVLGKGNKERILPIGGKAIEALQDWLKCRAEFALPDEVAVFVSKKKCRISTRQVRARMKLWGINQGISSQIHPHKLRHSFASHMLESSGDLRAVQELLGHSSLSATQVYTHLDFQHLAKVYDNTHPRAKKQR